MTSIPAQITFHGLAHSDALEAAINERMTWLSQFYDGIMGSRVLVEIPHRHQLAGRSVRVKVELSVRGAHPIVVSHEPPSDDPSRGDAHVIVHRAFDIARRQLQDHARAQRGSVKTHRDDAMPRHPGVEEPA